MSWTCFTLPVAVVAGHWVQDGAPIVLKTRPKLPYHFAQFAGIQTLLTIHVKDVRKRDRYLQLFVHIQFLLDPFEKQFTS